MNLFDILQFLILFRSLVRSISSKSGLLYKWLNPALLMISNILEPLNISECDTNKSSLQSSEENVPQGQGMLSHSDDSDLGTFFKDVVACHESRESFDESDQHESIYYSDDEYESEYNLDLMSLGDIHASRNEDEVCFLKKLKPEGTYFLEDRPRALNMRSHVFVMEEKENKNEIGDNVFSFMNKDNDHDDKINRKFHPGLTRSQSARNADTKELNCKDKDEDSNSTNTNNNQIYDFIDTRTRAKPVGALKANRQFLRRSFNDAIISVNRPGIKDSSSPSLSFLYDKSKEHGERRVRSTIDNGMNMRSNKRRKCLCQDICMCRTVPGLLRKESSRSGRIEENNQHGNEIKAIQQSCDDIRIQPCVSINSMESAFEMESKICALIVEKMTLHRDDIPISLEILFQSLRNICTRRNISGLDSRDIGCDVYYSCCSALLVNQLIAPALLQPIKWNLACPSSTHTKNLSTSFSASFSASSQSIDMEEFKSFSSYENSQSNPVSRTNSPKGGSLKDRTLDHSIPILFGDRNSFSGVSPLYGGGGGLTETSGKSSKASVYSPTAVRTHSRSDATHEAIQQSDINTYPMSLRFSKLLVGTNNVTGNSSGNVTAASSRNSSYEFKSPKYVTSSSSSSAASFYKCSGDSLQLSDDKDCRRDSMDTGVSTGSGPGIFVGSGSPKPLRSNLSFKIFRTDTNIHSEDGNDSAKTESDKERGGGERFKEGNKGRRVEEEKESKSGRNNHKKIVLSETLMHAAISLICIAHILGGEGKSLEALLCIWDDDKVQGNKIFAAARTLTNCVPLTKVNYRFYLYELFKVMITTVQNIKPNCIYEYHYLCLIISI